MTHTQFDLDRIVTALQCGQPRCRCSIRRFVHCPVPTHVDRVPHLEVSLKDGKLLVHCWPGCSQEAVILALKDRGLWPKDNSQWPPEVTSRTSTKKTAPKPPEVQEELVAVYEFKNAAGVVVALHERYEWGLVGEDGKRAKTFKWKQPDGTSGLGDLREADLPLFGAELIVAAAPDTPIFVVEGQKAALAGRKAGLLTVCFAGGSSRVAFGQELEQFRGKKVFLWPDNSADSRMFMARVHAVVRPIAKSITVLHPPLPEKGDAHEYFGGDGTVEELLAQAPPEEPVVEVLAYDAVKVIIPHPLGLTEWEATRITSERHALRCELVIRTGPGEPWKQRVNLLSASERDKLASTLGLSARGKEWGWRDLLNSAFMRIRDAYTSQQRPYRFAEVIAEPSLSWLIPIFVPEGAPSMWFGMGSAGKTYLALRASLAIVLGEKFLGQQARQGAVLYLDCEANGRRIWKRRVRRLWRGLYSDIQEEDIDPDLPFLYYPGRGIPLHEQTENIRRFVGENGISLMIVDSAGLACGGRPEEAESATRFFGALQAIGEEVTPLVLGHMTKAEEDRYPFGSIYWHHCSRKTWNVKRQTEDEEATELALALFCRKVNEEARPRPVSVKMSFVDDPDGPVSIELMPWSEAPADLDRKRGLSSRITELLRSIRAGTIEEIATELDEDPNTVRVTLQRGKKKQFIQIGSDGQPARAGVKGIWMLLDRLHSEV